MADFTLRQGFWECDDCAALVISTSRHHDWHEKHWPPEATRQTMADLALEAHLDDIERRVMAPRSEHARSPWVGGVVGGMLYQMPGVTGDPETDRWSYEAGLWNEHRGTKPVL